MVRNSSSSGNNRPLTYSFAVADLFSRYKVHATEPTGQWLQSSQRSRLGWFPAQNVAKIELSSPVIPKNVKVKKHLLRNVALQERLQVRFLRLQFHESTAHSHGALVSLSSGHIHGASQGWARGD